MTLMTIIDKSTLNKTNKQWLKLEKLWQDVEKKRLRNQRYQAKLDDFYNEFERCLLSKEHAVCDATALWVRHLLSFLPRKSIKGRQRDALLDLIQDELSILEANPFNPVNTAELRALFNALLLDYHASLPKQAISDDELDAFREDMLTLFGEAIDLNDTELTELIHNPEQFQAYMEQMLSQQHDADNTEQSEASFEQDEPEWNAQGDERRFDESRTVNLGLFENKAMTKLYRQLANQFHPDKEQDPSQKALKKVLMQQLSQAKKEKDALALLLMAQTYLPEYMLKADDDMANQMEITLHIKIGELNRAHQSMLRGNDLKSTLWHRFGGGGKASRARTLEQYGDTLMLEAEELLTKISKIKTVQAMQKELNTRARPVSFNGMFDEFDETVLNEFWGFN